jgi:aminoglycoside 6'-N-acetyltransferase
MLSDDQHHLNPAHVHFRPLAMEDLPRLYDWMNLDFVAQWWYGKPDNYDTVVQTHMPYILGEKRIYGFIIEYDATPIGYIQWYRIEDYSREYGHAVHAEECAAGIDLFIGEDTYLHKGLGCPVIQRFLREEVFTQPEIESCIIGPDPANTAAIHTYQRVGFTYWRTVYVPSEPTPEYLMRLGRDRLAQPVQQH